MNTELNNSSNASLEKRPVPFVRPPYLYGGALIAGIAAHFVFPVILFSNAALIAAPGVAIFAAGVFILVWAVKTFKKSGVDLRFKPVGKIIEKGPFSWSRNPMYISFTLIYLGISFVLNSAWPIVFLVPVIVIIYYGVVFREEKYLAQKFGAEYERYRGRVRRWL